ncbi:MAG TPA: thiamine-phosphate kinase [Hyphomicrobiales bacterium]|nr:thiamine-phosphate kinase [Rhodobiaceae bacterium]HXK53331.1 thiamine-phosphate kinase [Hyphomicrobiales bacterium]
MSKKGGRRNREETTSARPGESELIARYFAPLATAPGARKLIDDAASLGLEPGRELVVTVDMVVAGVHFLSTDPPATVARKALRVNLSDLAAKAAAPVGYLLALALPGDWTETWLAEFSAALADEQMRFGLSLYGGDTVRSAGALSLSVTAFGTVEQGRMLRRDAAQAEGRVLVSGTVGDAALGLKLALGQADAAKWGLSREEEAFLRDRYACPRPRLGLVEALRRHAAAAMDVSDGLVGDLEKMCAASGVSARIEVSRLPLSSAARKALAADPGLVEAILGGGDDYEILACVPAAQADVYRAAAREAGIEVADIGVFAPAGHGVSVVGADGAPVKLSRPSYSHF